MFNSASTVSGIPSPILRDRTRIHANFLRDVMFSLRADSDRYNVAEERELLEGVIAERGKISSLLRLQSISRREECFPSLSEFDLGAMNRFLHPISHSSV